MTGQTMIERVGVAIQAQFPTIGFKKAALDAAARAAIDAMREPTEGMKQVFSSARPESPRTVWHETIDATPARSAGE